MSIINELAVKYRNHHAGILTDNCKSYWSNLTKDENKLLIGSLNGLSAKSALLKYQPEHYEVIYSPKRCAGLELLGLQGDELCIDYGCMWGSLTVPLAKRTKLVVGIDQTLESLVFLKARMLEEKIDNIELVCADIRNIPLFENKIDVAIVNGVLEWVPEDGRVELKSYYGKYKLKNYSVNPFERQKNFLIRVNGNLKSGGRLYLAIENRYDYKMFLGVKDPHSSLRFTSILPRSIANVVSKLILGRPYVNWLYSFNEVKNLLKDSGFSKIELYSCFPNYRFPEQIFPYKDSLKWFKNMRAARNSKGELSVKRCVGKFLDSLIYGAMRARYFAPSIIAIAQK